MHRSTARRRSPPTALRRRHPSARLGSARTARAIRCSHPSRRSRRAPEPRLDRLSLDHRRLWRPRRRLGRREPARWRRPTSAGGAGSPPRTAWLSLRQPAHPSCSAWPASTVPAAALDAVASGTARRIVKPGQVFNRIHVEDIARVLAASIARPIRARAYNVCDDEPAPPQDVIAYAAELLSVAPPPEMPSPRPSYRRWRAASMPKQARLATRGSRRSSASGLRYPTYREGCRRSLLRRYSMIDTLIVDRLRR